MGTFEHRDQVIIVGVIVAMTVGLAYASPFSGDIRVTIALVGLALAFFVADRMKMRAYRERVYQHSVAEDRRRHGTER